jgi:3-deoxy-7-phosphoheptulonate synthase
VKTLPVAVGSESVGDGGFCVIAGPCSIESEDQFASTARFVKEQGASLLRGGVFKMRTSPETFQGLGTDALRIAQGVSQRLQMPMVSEITDVRQISDFVDCVEMFQVGSRNMYNYSLLSELGQVDKPVLLKRGFSATVDEWLNAAQYIVKGGNNKVILCERGIRTFENKTRNTLDLSIVPYIKQNSPFPVIVDPSHGTGVPSLIGPMVKAAAAAGADGVMVEVHPNPATALSDGFQALTFAHFASIMKELRVLLTALDRPLTGSHTQ